MDVRKQRLDNRGMTLVELLIAIVILAIITVPLLHAFVSAARVNMDSRKRLRLTTVAQDVMEGLRADTLAELATEFNYPDDPIPTNSFHVINRGLVNGGTGGLSENRCVIDPNGGVTGLTWVSLVATNINEYPSVEPVAGSLSYNFVPRDGSYDPARNDGKYYFTMENVTVEDASSATDRVDVIIEADASPYREGSPTVSGANALHNSFSFVDIDDMSERSDFLFKIDLQKLIDDNMPGVGLTTKDIYCEYDVEHEPGHIAKVRVRARRTTVPITGPTIFDESYQITRTESRNIFLLYYPTYGAKFHANPTSPADVINFTNNSSEDINFYIVKQNDTSDSYIRANLGACEDAYRCKVNIYDSGKHTIVRSNLDYNLSEVEDNEGSLVRMDSPGHPSGIRQSTYTYNSDIPIPTPDLSNPSKVDEKTYFPALGGNKMSDKLFDVTVYVYKEGSIATARTGGGSIPADNLLVSIDGTIR